MTSLARLALFLLLVVGVSACGERSAPGPVAEAQTPAPPPTVVAVGRLGPQGGVIKLSVPNASDSRVNQILVKEGDRVQANDVIAILQGIERRERDLAEALKTVEFHQARLAQAKAGNAKEADIASQKTNILRLEADLRTRRIEQQAAIDSAEAELREAQATFKRQLALANSGAISKQALDQARAVVETSRAAVAQQQARLANTEATMQQQLALEQENLASLQEVRPVDIQVAQAELERSEIAVEQRRAALEDTKVRVPIAGQILRINNKVGEQVNTREGIVEIGRTEQMYVRAEVYETEIGKVKVGQRVRIVSEYGGFEGEIAGTVDSIALQVGAAQLQGDSSNPTNDENTRVVAVDIRVDPTDNDKVSALTNMQVRVEIDTSSVATKSAGPAEPAGAIDVEPAEADSANVDLEPGNSDLGNLEP